MASSGVARGGLHRLDALPLYGVPRPGEGGPPGAGPPVDVPHDADHPAGGHCACPRSTDHLDGDHPAGCPCSNGPCLCPCLFPYRDHLADGPPCGCRSSDHLDDGRRNNGRPGADRLAGAPLEAARPWGGHPVVGPGSGHRAREGGPCANGGARLRLGFYRRIYIGRSSSDKSAQRAYQ